MTELAILQLRLIRAELAVVAEIIRTNTDRVKAHGALELGCTILRLDNLIKILEKKVVGVR